MTHHVIVDTQFNGYVSSGAKGAVSVTPFSYNARYFISPARALEFLVHCGFGDERVFSKRFRIRRLDACPNRLDSEQTVLQPKARERLRSRK